MVTLQGKTNETIKISFDNNISTSVNETTKKNTYVITPTVVTCSSYADAKILQEKINTFIYQASKELIESK